MQINKYKNGLSSGWFSESQRHSNAKKFGIAGGLYSKNTKEKIQDLQIEKSLDYNAKHSKNYKEFEKTMNYIFGRHLQNYLIRKNKKLNEEYFHYALKYEKPSLKRSDIENQKWKKIDSQSWSRGKQRLYADEDYAKDGTTIYLVRFEDENGESILFKSRNWDSALNYAKKEAKKEGLIKEHPSIYKY